MSLQDVLNAIDAEIARIEQARDLLAGSTAKSAKRVKRTLSPEARKRISDAQRKRWAAQKKAAK